MDRTLGADFLIRNWGFDDGLPSSRVNAIARTPDGFIWLATARGLVRFDGVDSITYNVSNSAVVDDENMTCLLVDREGMLWGGTMSGTLFRIENQRLTVVNLGTNVPHKKLQAMAQGDGAIWLALDGLGLVRLDRRGVETVTTRDGLRSDHISSMFSDAKGRLWVLADGQLQELDRGRWSSVKLPDAVQSLAAAALGDDCDLWMAGMPRRSAGRFDLPVYKLNDGRWTECPELTIPNDFARLGVTSVLQDKTGCRWCGTTGSGVLFQKPGQPWQQLAPESPSSQLDILCLAEEEAGAVWIGTRTAGLQQARPRLVTALHLPREYSDQSFLTACAGHDGAIWGGTDGAGIFCWHGGRLDHYGLEAGLANLHVNALVEDRQTNLWAATAGGVFKFGSGRFQPATGAAELKEATLSLFEDSQGNLWAGSHAGAVRWRDGQATVFGRDSGLPAAYVQCFAEDVQGRIWAGLPGGGVYRLDGGQFQPCVPLRRSDGVALDGWFDAKFVRALACDRDGSVWLGTQGFGLEHLKDGIVDQWKWPDDGLPSNHHFGILQDGQGNLWVSSESGIFGYPRGAFEHYRRWQTAPPVPWRLTTADGLAYNVCTGAGQPCAAKAADGRLWFPDGSALVAFDPAAVTRRLHVWPAAIDAVVVDGTPLPLVAGQPLRIKSGAVTFGFRYTSPNALCPERLSFRYQLEGLDQDWVEAGKGRVASYNRLPPGEYAFRVMANGPEGDWPPHAAALKLIVVPRFYERRSMQAAAGTALVLLVAGSVWGMERARSRRRLERLKLRYALDRERQRIARDIHDDLGAGLTEIILLSDTLREEMQPLRVDDKMVREIAGRARALTRSMDEVVWAINPRNDSLESFMTYLNKFAQEFLTRAGLHCRWDVPLELPNAPLTAETRHSLYLASKETLNNIVKHAGATEVWIRLEVNAERFCLTFEDNGRGLPPAASAAGRNGLGNLQHRLEELRGRCEVVSVPGRGTKVKFIIPLAQPVAAAGVAES